VAPWRKNKFMQPLNENDSKWAAQAVAALLARCTLRAAEVLAWLEDETWL
jgi:hypothetical protein